MPFRQLRSRSLSNTGGTRKLLNKLAKTTLGPVAVAALLVAAPMSYASSHREAPFISGQQKVDGTDLYMFRS